MRVHLAAEHAFEFELVDLGLEGRDLALDLRSGGDILFVAGHFQQLQGVGQARLGAIQCLELLREVRAFAAQFLRLLGLVPDAGRFEFERDFF